MPLLLALVIFIGCTITNTAIAQPVDEPVWQQVSDKALAEIRAGFVLDNGLVVNIRLDKQLFVNGELVSQTYFDSADAMGQKLASFSGDELNTVLQNSLNDQVLSSVTQMDISISNLSAVQQNIMQTALYQALYNRALGN
jgi:transcription termination factor NusB